VQSAAAPNSLILRVSRSNDGRGLQPMHFGRSPESPAPAAACYRNVMRPALDTSRSAADLQENILRRRTATDRLRMAAEMSEFARKLTRAGIRLSAPDASEAEIDREMLRRMYGFDKT
jgi:hypothetical protein